MNEKNDKSPKNERDPNDPYNFFKFAGPEENKNDDDKKKKKKKRHFPLFGVLIIIFLLILLFDKVILNKSEPLINYSDFMAKVESGEINAVEIDEQYLIGYQSKNALDEDKSAGIFNTGKKTKSYKTVGVVTDKLLNTFDEKGVTYKFEAKSNNYFLQILLNVIIPFGIIFIIYFLVFRKMNGGAGGMGSIFGVGNSRAKSVEEGKVKTRFSDVAGVDEAKEELVEVVDFLKQPKKYTDIGGKIPKGVLLVGPPGTGKTLLARAVAGEAGVPFFRISGSDFVEMFVGVGASRVRDLFKQAREKAPCIIFIDELDAIGKSRVNNLGGNDEREQTLNQLLVEMDGFDNEKGLIILGATNRADVLDPALLRPGRFDRQVIVDRPDAKGREAILKIHAKNVKVDKSVDYTALAHTTVGFAGADLANLVNEAALFAVRRGRQLVTMDDFNEAFEKIAFGIQRKSHEVKEKARHLTAYHETGHALVAAFTPGSDPVHKITIIPRGQAGGYTWTRPDTEDFMTKSRLIGEVDLCLGGRAAEEIVFGEISTGASSDISRATSIIKSMITDYGMSEKFKNVTLGKTGRGYGGPTEPELVREFSEETQRYIDEEVARMMDERYQHVLQILGEHKALLDYVARLLLKQESIEGKEFEDIVKSESRLDILVSEAGKKAEEELYINAAAAPELLEQSEKKSLEAPSHDTVQDNAVDVEVSAEATNAAAELRTTADEMKEDAVQPENTGEAVAGGQESEKGE